MVKTQTKTGKPVNWTYTNDYCEIIAEDRVEGRIWEYVAILYGLKQFMKADYMKAIYGCFEIFGRQVRYSCYIGSDAEIKRWNIYQESADGEMWDDIRFLIDGMASSI